MKRRITTSFFISSVLITTIALAQSSGGAFEITRSTIDSGGGISSGGDFSLIGTIGQPEANAQLSKGGGYSLAGGFLASAAIVDVIFEDGFEINN